ncbi:MAG: glycosyltransferase family 4 protein, partial [Miltoncostaeaceae bacterium]
AVRWPRWHLYRAPDPWPAVVERGLRGREGVFHATQPALVPRGEAVVATCYDLIPLRYPRWYLNGPSRAAERRAYSRYLERLRGARLVWAISEETKRDAVRLAGADPARVRVVPLAAAPEVAPDGEVPDEPYVLFAGGSEPHKNATVALEAIARSPGDAKLVMTGAWSPRRAERMRRRARGLGAADRVEWLGWVSPGRMAALRGGAAAVLVPSWAEGFGLPVLEAMRSGVPALASDIPALREAGGDAAVYLPPADAAAWAAAIDEAVGGGRREELAAAGRAQADAFSWEATAWAVNRLYEEAAA